MASDAEVPARLLQGFLPGIGQALVTIWPDGSAEVAWRPTDFDTWSPPAELTDWPTR